MTEQDVEQLLTQAKAITKGHILLPSGLHTDKYVEKYRLLQYPKFTAQLCQELATRFKDDQIDVVIAPAVSGIVVAHEIAKALGARAIFTEREESGNLALRRGFEIKSGERVLIVEDILSGANSIEENLNIVIAQGGQAVGTGILVDASDEEIVFGNLKTEVLLYLDVMASKSSDCPLCHYEMNITKRIK